MSSTDARVRLLEAVDVLIQRLGYRKMTVENVVREAGVSRAAAYLDHSKQALVLAWASERARVRQQRMREQAAGSGSALERLRLLLDSRTTELFESSRRYVQSLDDLIADMREHGREQWLQDRETEAAIVAGLLREQGLGGPDPLQTAHLLLLATGALLPGNLKALAGSEDPALFRSRLDTLLCLLLEGLRAR